MNIQWYPGHMTRAKRQLKEQLKIIDVVIEVLDARLPFSSQNSDFDSLFEGKKRFYILNKTDLADDRVTDRWMNWFEKNGIPAMKYSAHTGNTSLLLSRLTEFSSGIVEKYREKGVNKTVRALVVGIPNVGKSAILNRLSGSKKAKEENRPGVTRGLQWVRVTEHFEILDSPGLLMPKISDEESAAKIAFIGSIKQEILNTEELAFYLIKFLSFSNPGLLEDRYDLKLDDQNEPLDIMDAICRRRGFLLKGGELDYDRCARTVLDEFRKGKMGRITLELPE